MSETSTNEPNTLVMGEYSAIEQKSYKNGAMHVYGVDPETGKKKHLSHEEILQAYGHSSKERKAYNAEYAQNSLDAENEAHDDEQDAQEELDQEWLDLQESFSNARESGSVDDMQHALDLYKMFVEQFEDMDEADKKNMLAELLNPKQETVNQQQFSINDTVRVRRTSGELEDGWIVEAIIQTSEGVDYKVTHPANDGSNDNLVKLISESKLIEANSEEALQAVKEGSQERDTKEKFAIGTTVAILRDDKTVVEGEVVDFQDDEDGFKYVIEANDGGRYAVPVSMVVLPEAVDYEVYAKIASQEDHDEPDSGDSNDTPEQGSEPKEADDNEGSTNESGDGTESGSEKEQGSEGQNSTELSAQDKIMAKALLVASIIKQKRNEAIVAWREAPRKRKILYGAGAAALVLAGVWLLKENANMFDGNADITADAPNSDTPLAGGPDAIDTPNTDASTNPSPDSNNSGGPSGPDTSSVSEAAQNVEKGEGWFQTFEELGVKSEADQKELLKQIGPKLVKMGVAYSDAGIGGYGISSPGELPKDVIKMITNVAKAEGYIS